MDAATRAALEGVNRSFYHDHAESFSQTRDYPWPGWERIAARIPAGESELLDAGCGNGRFARFLAEQGYTGVHYTGVDGSPRLLADAEKTLRAWPAGSTRLCAMDLFDPQLPSGPFDAIVLFGVLHHIAGFENRVALVERLGSLLMEGGFVAATLWRFGQDARAARRSADFDAHAVRVDPAALEPGDRLLEWRETAGAVRYCHFVDDEEVERLVAASDAAGLEVLDRFRSDGRSGDLNEYLVWTRRDG